MGAIQNSINAAMASAGVAARMISNEKDQVMNKAISEKNKVDEAKQAQNDALYQHDKAATELVETKKSLAEDKENAQWDIEEANQDIKAGTELMKEAKTEAEQKYLIDEMGKAFEKGSAAEKKLQDIERSIGYSETRYNDALRNLTRSIEVRSRIEKQAKVHFKRARRWGGRF